MVSPQPDQAPDAFLMALGGILLLGLATSFLSKSTPLPRVTLLLLFGIAIGDQGLGVIPEVFTDRFSLISDMTLLMVGFLIGGKLTHASLHRSAKSILWVSLSGALVTMVVVTLGLIWVGLSPPIAIILGAIAAATAPAAILDVVHESGGNSRFGQLLLSVVAVDDVWALLLFGLALATVSGLNGSGMDGGIVLHSIQDIGGALLLGAAVGLPSAYLTGRLKDGQPMLTEALGVVFLTGGLAMWLEVSYLIAVMSVGALIANLAKHHDYPFHAIEGVESLFMVIFFVVAGASLELDALANLGWVGVVFVFCRIAGKYLGAFVGGVFGRLTPAYRNWLGLAMLPQAGVPIGMALVAGNRFPEYQQTLLTLVVSTTVLFEVLGPVFARLAISRACESDQAGAVKSDRKN
ncbi:hypothetical protein HMF8227_02955 [Saliniradius amylolyticus]|uniref:Cation/H+ exchanger transmembrane domain-containing protein n=1 Tax=Saliniradius amylolyticus TaxID=2183582 RepID=A0A2S2E6X0_9ALTE|nr:cation:proton antiporter [Saliniradius amylolyticus]AWL13403.1 hypothetical protein HMF8227_02955 [Saliniradius amylolyticus]